MERDPRKLKAINVCNELVNYRTIKNPCSVCIQFKELIQNQNIVMGEIMREQNIIRQEVGKLQATTEHQNKVIVEMLADQKIQLKTIQNPRQNIAALTTSFPLKTDDDLKKMECEILEANQEKYISAVKHLLDGNAMKNLERVLSRELCMMYNTDGICGKKSIKSFKNIYKILIAAIEHFSSNPDKELRSAIQVVKKRHFRSISLQKKELGLLTRHKN